MADEHILITLICTELRKSWSGLLSVVEREGSLRVSKAILLHGEWFLFKDSHEEVSDWREDEEG